MDKIEKSGKTVEEALEAALTELGVTRDQVEYRVLEAPSKPLFGLLGGKEAKVEVTVNKIDPVANAKQFLSSVAKAMGLNVLIEVNSTDESVVLNLRGEDLGLLIRDALQYLTNLASHRESRDRIRLVVDIEDYRRRRAVTLEQLALRLADRVRRSGERVALEPMNPHERKIIHMSLQEDPRIETFSEGEDPFRRVVIALKK